MTNDAVVWTVIILCKIIICLAILFCCTNNRRKNRNISNRHTIITSSMTNPQQIVNLPYEHQTNVPVYNVVPQPNQSYAQPHHQLYNLTDDLPPSYSEAVKSYSKNKI